MVSVAQLIPILPEGYAERCGELCGIERWRGIKTPEDLMQLSLFHLLNGCSLIEISQIAKLTRIADISDVAFMNRFAACGSWFSAICSEMTPGLVADYEKPAYLKDYRTIAFDASDVSEKGRSGQIYRLHYGIDIFTMRAVSHKITDNKTGEKMSNFALSEGDLAIADRAYATINGIEHCLKNQADFIFRLRVNSFSVYDEYGSKIDIISKISHLKCEQNAELSAFVHKGDKKIPIRICVRKKDKEAQDKTKKKLNRRASRKQQKLSESTEIFNEYIILTTSLPSEVSCDEILNTYRYRWQIENYFKRLKSIMDFGELPKKREDSSMAWLNGKLMVALMIELLVAKLVFSPAE
jgi:transposase